jgi:ribosome maturation protein Sdo1
MTKQLKEVLERAEAWPEEDQQELAELVRDIEARRTGVYHPSVEELAAIDEALGQVARGEVASKDEVDAAFATFRGK